MRRIKELIPFGKLISMKRNIFPNCLRLCYGQKLGEFTLGSKLTNTSVIIFEFKNKWTIHQKLMRLKTG